MILFPHAKINIGLNILEKRPDGFHNIETVFYPIELCDVLEFIESPDGNMKFENSGIQAGNHDQNLCMKAYYLLKNKFDIPPVHVHLQKNIPIGAGLGGGSSDGAFMMKGLNEHFNLGLKDAELAWLTADLGSDCPFFIYSKPLFARGKGDEFSETHLCLKDHHIVLIYPEVFVPTKDAYAGTMPGIPQIPLKELLHLECSQWQGRIRNQFEESVFKKYPEIEHVKSMLMKEGALYTAMSGSGSSVYGIFEQKIDTSAFNKNYFVWEGILN